MTTGADQPRAVSFCSGAYNHFENFRKTLRTGDLPILVRVTLLNGAQFYCVGMWLRGLEDVPGCIMLHGMPKSAEGALVVRDDHVVSFEYIIQKPSVDSPNPFGFNQTPA